MTRARGSRPSARETLALASRLACLTLVSLLCVTATARAQNATPSWPETCQVGELPLGAKSLICVPPIWNRQLVVFAHGYVAPDAPLEFAHLQLGDGTSLPELIQQLGFAFATTTYRRNGLAVLEGVDDILNLVDAFEQTHGPAAQTFLTGVSEGGLVTTLAIEREPTRFTGGLATCGPIGNFRFQINYIGDFRVLFDAYFPGVLPGTPVEVPQGVRDNWEKAYVPAITRLLRRQPERARELLRVARAPHDPADPRTVVNTALGLLWYNVFAANDTRRQLGGNPYDNRTRWYSGASNDLLLNLRVRRFDGETVALVKLQEYTPAGDLRVPLVTLHTTSDEIVPYAHELLYGIRVQPADRGQFLPVPILRYGHCQFTRTEILTGFALMLGTTPSVTSSQSPVASAEIEAPIVGLDQPLLARHF